MQSLASREQIQQQGVPVTVEVTIRAPQNGQSSLESTPILAQYKSTLNGVSPQYFQEASQHLSEQLSQLAQQEISEQFQLQQGQQTTMFRRGQQQMWGSQGQGQGQQAAAGGSR